MKEPGDMFAEASAIIDNLPVLHAIAAELEASRLCMEQLGMTLCLDPNLVQAHLPALQKLDELGQRQFCLAQVLRCLAQVLRAADMRTAVADIPLDALRDRMAEYIEGRQRS
jgi:hypothetical protein